MPTADLDRLDALLTAATPGPWAWEERPADTTIGMVEALVGAGRALVLDLGEDPGEPYYGGRAGDHPTEADAALIAAAVNALPALIAELRAARERIAELEAAP